MDSSTNIRIQDAFIAISADGKFLDLGFGNNAYKLSCNVFLTSCEKVDSIGYDEVRIKLNVIKGSDQLELVNTSRMLTRPCGPCYHERKTIHTKE